MKLGIMQPYFLPYIGYFQLINAVDVFVVYDNIKYTKKGWINRNRFLLNGKDTLFTIPISKDSDFLDIKDRHIADNFDKKKIITQLKSSYSKNPEYQKVMPLVEDCILCMDNNLFDYIFYSLGIICTYLNIKTQFQISSQIDINHELKGQNKVLEICKKMNASVYINAIGGQELYSKEIFKNNGMDLKFIKSNGIEYPQFKHEFVPWLSIIDVMMFNSKEKISDYLNIQYTLN
ncbi:hypothetical protein FACS189420_2960 [Bacteroidia bacterium]|nr:hypothetical protein FACS189420_2960 [Bacteroidia bacterium]